MAQTKKASELVVGDCIRYDGDPVTVASIGVITVMTEELAGLELMALVRTASGREQEVGFRRDQPVVMA